MILQFKDKNVWPFLSHLSNEAQINVKFPFEYPARTEPHFTAASNKH